MPLSKTYICSQTIWIFCLLNYRRKNERSRIKEHDDAYKIRENLAEIDIWKTVVGCLETFYDLRWRNFKFLILSVFIGNRPTRAEFIALAPLPMFILLSSICLAYFDFGWRLLVSPITLNVYRFRTEKKLHPMIQELIFTENHMVWTKDILFLENMTVLKVIPTWGFSCSVNYLFISLCPKRRN